MKHDVLSLVSAVLNEDSNVKLSDNAEWEKIIKTAKKHNIISPVYKGIELLPEDKQPDEKLLQQLKRKYYSEVQQNVRQLYEIERLQSAFETSGIYSIALKGCNTKLRYPEETLRSMGDLDLLIKPSQNKRVFEVMQKLGYTDFEEGRKHDHYHGASKVGIEMHRDLVPAESEFFEYYNDIWVKCKPKTGKKYTYEMSVEDEYIFNIIHLIQHFKLGGIGIRFIMDVYVYNNLCILDSEYVTNELRKLGIDAFVDNLVKLANCWFGGKQYSDSEMAILRKLGSYIFNCGVFGTRENASALQTNEGKNRFLIRAFFPSYKSMVSLYPWLNRKPFLLPFAWLHRGVKSFLFRRSHIKTMVNIYKNSDNEKTQELKNFYKDCGLEI